MSLINCAICKKLTIEKGSKLCTDCLLQQREDIKNIKAYLAKNPHATLAETQRDTGVAFHHLHALMVDAENK